MSKPVMQNNQLDRIWSGHAITLEIAKIAKYEDKLFKKIGKPGNEVSISILKIASILNGSGYMLDKFETYKLVFIAVGNRLNERTLIKVWAKALRCAYPRYRSEK